MDKTLEFSLEADSDGFLSQECPSCGKRFKVRFGEGSDQPIHFCAFCGHEGEGCWWTQEQANYLSGLAASQVLGPQLEKMANDFNRKVGTGRDLLKVSMKVSRPSTPERPHEPEDDWRKTRFQCCNEVIKHPPGARVRCIICGSDEVASQTHE